MAVLGGVDAVNVGAVPDVAVTTVQAADTAGDTAPVAVTVKLAVPAVVGVPARTPPVVRVRPAGRLPAVTANVMGVVPDAVNV